MTTGQSLQPCDDDERPEATPATTERNFNIFSLECLVNYFVDGRRFLVNFLIFASRRLVRAFWLPFGCLTMAELRHGINFSSCSGRSTYLADKAATTLIAKEVQTSWPPGPFLLPHLIRSICETGGAAAAGDRNEEATAAVQQESRRWRAWLYLGKYLKGAMTEPTRLSLSLIGAFAFYRRTEF
jgi:hypothetical protein